MNENTSQDVEFMRRAVDEAAKCVSEDERTHPKVGVVVVKEGLVIAAAFRGEIEDGDHAEFTVLEKKLRTDNLAGATVYSTLEPCVTRNHPKVPCAIRLIERKVKRVVIGMLDPNQNICGRGIRALRHAGIATDLFPPNLMSIVEEQNREFTREHDTSSTLQVDLKTMMSAAGIISIIPSREYYREFRKGAAGIDHYVGIADQSIVIVSVNLMTGLPFDGLRKTISDKLMGHPELKATISLLNPNKEDLMKVIAPIFCVSP